MFSASPSSPFPRRRLSAEIRPSHGLIRPIYAGVFDIDPNGFDQARDEAITWLRKHPTVAPHISTLGDGDFEIDRLRENDGLLAQVATGLDGNCVVARLQHQEPSGSGRFDPARNWRTDITIEQSDSTAWIATRIWFAGVASDVRECLPPRFIKYLWSAGALSDLDILSPTVRELEYDPEADGLADLILDVDRDLPVVVVADGCPLDPHRVARDSIGLAHIFKVARGVRMRLIQSLEYKYELSHGAVQTFYPRADGATPTAPAARFETIIEWRYSGLSGPAAFAKWLHEEMGRAVVLRLLNDPAHRTIEGVRAVAVEAQRAALSSQTQDAETMRSELALSNELRELLEYENADLQKQMTELTDRAERYLEDRRSLDDGLRAELARNHSLQQEKASLLHQLAAKNGSERITFDAPSVEALITQQPEASTVFDAVDQAKKLFELYGAPVVVTETAFESSMNSPFKRPEAVLAALLRIGFLWGEIRAARRPLEEVIHEVVQVPCALHESRTARNQYAEERTTRIGHTQVMLEKHLKLGSGGADTSLRVYFGDRNDQLLIGHVGRHLTTAKTQ
jgi:hypothetical protein